MIPKHHIHAFLNRGLHCLGLILFILGLGTIGIRVFEHLSYIDAFYFTCMIATGQGPAPNVSPVTVYGKLFTCLLAFVSTGSMVASLGYLFGPMMGHLWKLGLTKVEAELEHFHKPK